jgi:predicted glycoside hydrolase/deacetylase ChbG (UPF0249 family)
MLRHWSTHHPLNASIDGVALPPGTFESPSRLWSLLSRSFTLDLTGKADRYAELLRDLPAGLSEWAVHPAVRTDEAEAIDPGWQVRHSDYEFLTSPNARALLDREGITVIDYSVVQRAWSP